MSFLGLYGIPISFLGLYGIPISFPGLYRIQSPPFPGSSGTEGWWGCGAVGLWGGGAVGRWGHIPLQHSAEGHPRLQCGAVLSPAVPGGGRQHYQPCGASVPLHGLQAGQVGSHHWGTPGGAPPPPPIPAPRVSPTHPSAPVGTPALLVLVTPNDDRGALWGRRPNPGGLWGADPPPPPPLLLLLLLPLLRPPPAAGRVLK